MTARAPARLRTAACGSLALALVGGAPAAWPQPAIYAVPAEAPAPPPQRVARSVLFDARGAAAARERAQPLYVESIVVEGRDPDLRRPRAKPLEQRFAEALLAPPATGSIGYKPLDGRPCMSLPSTWNDLGDSHTPLSGCP